MNEVPHRLATLRAALAEQAECGAMIANAPCEGGLARLVGGAREAVNGCARRLVEAGAMLRDRAGVVIRDLTTLETEGEWPWTLEPAG